MSRTLSKLFIRINVGVYAVNFVVLFVAYVLFMSLRFKAGLIFILPGMLLAALICLVFPNFFNVVAGAFGMQQSATPSAQLIIEQLGKLLDMPNVVQLKQNGIVTASICMLICWLVGIVCLFQQGKLLRIASSPMDWYKKRAFPTFSYALFGLLYGVTMCVGSMAIVFAKEKLSGGLLTLGWFFVICGLVVIAGVVILVVERFLTVQTYKALTVEEQIELCEKQSKYMNKRIRKRQINRLGENARYKKDTATEQPDNSQKKGKKGRKKDGGQNGKPIQTVMPDQTIAPTESPKKKGKKGSEQPPVDYVPTDESGKKGKRGKKKSVQPVEQPTEPTENPPQN